MLFLIFTILWLTSGYSTQTSETRQSQHIHKQILSLTIVTILFTEFLSYFDLFTINSIRITLVAGISLLLALKWKNISAAFRYFFSSATFQKIGNHILEIIVFILLAASALLYSPSNWDSNTYHLPRIIAWLQQGSLDFFPTHIYRQVYQPPLSEIQLTWIYASMGPVSMVNLLQVLYLGAVVCLLYSLNRDILPARYKIEDKNILFLVLVIFSLLLQSVTNKNDVVVFYFLLLVMYEALNWILRDRLDYTQFAAAAVLAILTKGTAYIYLFSFALLTIPFLILNKRINGQFFTTKIPRLLLTTALFTLLALPTFNRNYQLTGNLTGQDQQELKTYKNEIIGIKPTVSNLIKNISLHINLPMLDIGVTNIVTIIHQQFHLPDVHDHRLNYAAQTYTSSDGKLRHFFDSGHVPNFILFWGLLVSGLLLIVEKKLRKFVVAWTLVVSSAGFILLVFSASLKWQLWHTRLLFPVFILLSYAILLIFQHSKFFLLYRIIAVGCGLVCIVFNDSQPLREHYRITQRFGSITGDYYDRMPATWSREGDYKRINDEIRQHKKIGIICANDDLIFPFMAAFRSNHNQYYYLDVSNPTRLITQQIPPLDYLLVSKLTSHWKNKKINNTDYQPVFTDQVADEQLFWVLYKKKG